MKYLFINSVAGYGSTGKIALKQCEELEKQGHECVLAFGRIKSNCGSIQTYQIGTKVDYCIHGLFTRLFDLHGFGSKRATKKFLKWVDSYNPDVVWLHNIHGYYINFVYLFEWMKKHQEKKYYWTLHDCWTMTGHCSHFIAVNCEQWKEGCHKCNQLKAYPQCVFAGNVKNNYKRKKDSFVGIKNMTIVTPSEWLKSIVKNSYLRDYPVEVHQTQIDKAIFKPLNSETVKRVRLKYEVTDKTVILGVANVWNPQKGLYDFITLSEKLDENYIIILVGLSSAQVAEIMTLNKDKKTQIIGLERTRDVSQLVELYSMADVFVNPTYEDTYPTVNLEAEACGTPVITYDVGGCRETVQMSKSSVILADVERLVRELKGRENA